MTTPHYFDLSSYVFSARMSSHLSRPKTEIASKNANFVRKSAESCYFTEIPLVYAQKILSTVVIR